jgi:hypothetical protein
MRRTPIATFIVLEMLFLAATQTWGGWPWTLIGVVAICTQILIDARPQALAMVAPSLVWLALFQGTGNRELFFPFTIHLASLLTLRSAQGSVWLGMAGGGLLVAVFLAIRASQQASVKVLGVECVVAALILAVVLATVPVVRGRNAVAGGVVILASLLAYVSLAL